MAYRSDDTKELKRNTINNLMTYGKAKGIVLLQKYLPKLNPFTGIRIIKDINEWEQIKDTCPERITQRTDTKIGDPRNVRISGTSGKKEDVPECLRQIKMQNPDGVLLLLSMKEETIPRYKNDGGFNVAFNVGENVIIELVGKGFDGAELTRGKAVHERYVIPWDSILFMKDRYDLQKSRDVSTYLVEDSKYQKSREERVGWLKSIESNTDEIEASVPTKYKRFDNDFIKSMLDDVVLPIYERQKELKGDGLNIFNIQGNIVDGRIVPWEIFRPERLIAKSKEEREQI